MELSDLGLHFLSRPLWEATSVQNFRTFTVIIIEPQHEISNNGVCATNKASDQPAHMRSLIRAFASRLNIL